MGLGGRLWSLSFLFWCKQREERISVMQRAPGRTAVRLRDMQGSLASRSPSWVALQVRFSVHFLCSTDQEHSLLDTTGVYVVNSVTHRHRRVDLVLSVNSVFARPLRCRLWRHRAVSVPEQRLLLYVSASHDRSSAGYPASLLLSQWGRQLV